MPPGTRGRVGDEDGGRADCTGTRGEEEPGGLECPELTEGLKRLVLVILKWKLRDGNINVRGSFTPFIEMGWSGDSASCAPLEPR